MNKRETAMILARVVDIDRRTLSDTVVETWHELLGDLEYRDALEALHIVARDQTETIKPAHIRRAIRQARIERERRERAQVRGEALALASMQNRPIPRGEQ